MQIKAFIIYNFFDFNSNKPTIGGVQTYLKDLIDVLVGLNIKPIVYQLGSDDRDASLANYEVRQYNVKDISALIGQIKDCANTADDLLIYGSDTLIVPNDGFQHSIGIQHGISWDIPVNTNHSILRYIAATAWQTYKTIKRINNVKCLVCVDYNFQNWYRTQVDHDRTFLTVIPNYTHIGPVLQKNAESINIIFARRFFPYRGTRVFTQAIKRILREYSNVNVTIAGSGPDEEWMKIELQGIDHVVFTAYSSEDSLKIHADKHIAVVPTVGSEGTSLSLLEAMSAQCAVVASDVGGITNILIDGYNGLIVKAGDSDQLYIAIKRLIDNPQEREQLAMAGHSTVFHGFSHEKWVNSWKNVINHILLSGE